MIIILCVSLIWGVFLSLFVLSPLWSLSSKRLSDDASKRSDGKILEASLLQIKDQLLSKLIFNRCDAEELNHLSELELRSRLYSICEKLEEKEIDWRVCTVAKGNSSQSGKATLKFIIVSFLLLSIAFFSFFVSKHVQALPPGSPSEVNIPPPIVMPETGYWLPSVNQFILLPKQGALHVYYVGMFSNSFQAVGTKIVLPLPKDLLNLQIQFRKDTVVQKFPCHNHSCLVLDTSLEKTVNQVQAEFDVPAQYGKAKWQKDGLDVLPGVTIFIMPLYAGILTDKFPNIFEKINIWPPRFEKDLPDFKSFVSSDILKNNEKNKNLASDLSRQFVRVGKEGALYPEFNIIGIVPSRWYLYLLVLFFSCFFIAAAGYFIVRNKNEGMDSRFRGNDK